VERDELIELLRSHRRRWPIARILTDPPGFRAECEQLLRDLPTEEAIPPSGWLDETWLDRMLFDRPRHRDEHQQPYRSDDQAA
jgi:hypothetical protein